MSKPQHQLADGTFTEKPVRETQQYKLWDYVRKHPRSSMQEIRDGLGLKYVPATAVTDLLINGLMTGKRSRVRVGNGWSRPLMRYEAATDIYKRPITAKSMYVEKKKSQQACVSDVELSAKLTVEAMTLSKAREVYQILKSIFGEAA